MTVEPDDSPEVSAKRLEVYQGLSAEFRNYLSNTVVSNGLTSWLFQYGTPESIPKLLTFSIGLAGAVIIRSIEDGYIEVTEKGLKAAGEQAQDDQAAAVKARPAAGLYI